MQLEPMDSPQSGIGGTDAQVPPSSTTNAPLGADAVSNDTVDQGKTIALIAYLTVIGLLIALVLNSDKKNAFAQFHIRQSLGLMLTGFALSLVGMIPFLGWVVSLIGLVVMLYMWICGLLNALNGRERPLPILGTKYMEWFRTL